jgi:hypothetical protein
MSYIIRVCPLCGIYGHCTGQCRVHSSPPNSIPYAPGYRPDVPIGAPTFPYIPPIPKGCICPSGSETTCQRKDCGRKEPSSAMPAPWRPDQWLGFGKVD